VALSGPASSEPVSDFTPMEEIVAKVWFDVLKRDHAGRRDNFFEIGGHSLLATQVVSRIRDALGVEVPLRVLFEAPTLAEFARQVEQFSQRAHALSAPPLSALHQETASLSFAQQRLWFAHQLEPRSTAYTIVTAVGIAGRLNLAVLRRSIAEIIRRHEVLRTSFPASDGLPRQRVLESPASAGCEADLSGLDGFQAESIVPLLAESMRATPFQLECGELMRVLICRIAPEKHVLVLCMHHIIGDAWSVTIFINELRVLFEAFSTGRASPLPELPLQYTDFATWEHEYLGRPSYSQTSFDYWRGQLEGLRRAGVPPDFARTASLTRVARSVEISLSAELSARLRERARAETVSLFMVLASGLQCLLARYSGATEAAIGTSIANRNRSETETLIGYFVNQLVLRAKFDDDPTITEILHRTRRSVLDAYLHQDIPFDLLVEELKPDREAGSSAFFQLLLVFQNAPASTLNLAGLELESLDLGDPPSAKFDLTLFLHEAGAEIQGALHYNAAIFAPETITRFIEHYQFVLSEFADRPANRFSCISLLKPGQMAEAATAFSSPFAPSV
jgi:hypothetical protein